MGHSAMLGGKQASPWSTWQSQVFHFTTALNGIVMMVTNDVLGHQTHF